MSGLGRGRAGTLLLLGLCSVPIAALEGMRIVGSTPFTWSGLGQRSLFVAGLLLLSRWTKVSAFSDGRLLLPWPYLVVAGVGLAATAAYASSRATWAAWSMVACLIALLGQIPSAVERRRWCPGAVSQALLVLFVGTVPVAIAQLESRFAEEEFFAALQAAGLGLFCATLLPARWALVRWKAIALRSGVRLRRSWATGGLLALALAALIGSARAYQCSFYPAQAPAYPNISSDSPFVCGLAQPDAEAVSGEQAFRLVLERVAAHPLKESPEYGMLALGTGESTYASQFRQAMLAEAMEGRFTGPAHSVKFDQYLASLRAYYLPRVQAAFPGLFSPDDLARLRDWFADINSRALNVEAVDWMYGVAFSHWPYGPYDNQENGAGLLALLEAQGLAAPSLSLSNQEYLGNHGGGWEERFRNTDDAFIYQGEWINNAYYQSLYAGMTDRDNMQRAFEWLLVQALPDGAPLSYNFPARPSLAGVALLGATLLDDPRYVWLAGRAATYAEAHGEPLSAQPGADQAPALAGASPTLGSCLLYGDSGLPNQDGPLGPDKIVFRDGWSADAAYLLLNLRFTGWHRYKATNTITLLYQSQPLVADDLTGKPFRWLPTGRSLFRDKRIPRENLSGLLVERSGMSAVVTALTGIGGPWAQDPPYFAGVLAFETGAELDWSHSRLSGWRGWQHDRWIYFYHGGGPIVVVDEATGPPGSQGAISWQPVGTSTAEDDSLWLGGSDKATKMVVLPIDGSLEMTTGDNGRSVEVERADGQATLLVNTRHRSPLRLITLFLSGSWAQAQVEYEPTTETVHLTAGSAQLSLTVPWDEER